MSTSTSAPHSSGSSSSSGAGARRFAGPLATAALMLLALAAAACENQYYCEGKNPLNNCLAEATGPTCKSTADCVATPSTPACDLDGAMTCVQCTLAEPAACKGQTPVCGGIACRGCAADNECASGTCQPDGACGSDQTVAYVDPAGTDTDSCTKAAPCTKVSKAINTRRPFVRFNGATSDPVTIDNGTDVTFFAAPGAKLTRTSGIGVEVKGSGKLTIYDLEISGAGAGNTSGISLPNGNTATLTLVRAKVTGNNGGGLVAVNGTLKIHQSQFIGNFGGGISLTGTRFEILNNFIVKNGSTMSNFGGVFFTQISTAGNRFEFNTVTRNSGNDNVITGVDCTALTPVSLANNIVYGNIVIGTGKQVRADANCTWTYSNIGPDAVGGDSNLNTSPAFVDPLANDFHLMPGSPGQNRADVTTSVRVDIDGDLRPQGPGPDMGADEIR